MRAKAQFRTAPAHAALQNWREAWPAATPARQLPPDPAEAKAPHITLHRAHGPPGDQMSQHRLMQRPPPARPVSGTADKRCRLEVMPRGGGSSRQVNSKKTSSSPPKIAGPAATSARMHVRRLRRAPATLWTRQPRERGRAGGVRRARVGAALEQQLHQAGTLSGNPIAMAAGLATLDIISQPGFYQPLFDRTEQLCDGLRQAAAKAGVPFTTNHAGTMFGGFFTGDEQVSNYAGVMACNGAAFNQFFHRRLELGVYLAPASYEAGFMSSAHSEQDIADTVTAAATAMSGL